MKITVFLAMAFAGLLQIQSVSAATQLNTLSPSKWDAAMDVPIHIGARPLSQDRSVAYRLEDVPIHIGASKSSDAASIGFV